MGRWGWGQWGSGQWGSGRRIGRRLVALAASRPRLVEAGLILLGAGCLSWIYGPDNNWDLRNYHLYAPFALLDGRLSEDLEAAGSQTYFNPLIDLPFYLLSVRVIPHWPRLVAFLAGIPFGLTVLVVLGLARMVLPQRQTWGQAGGQNWLAIGATAAGVTGTASLSEIGTTYGDTMIAVLVLGGLAVPLALLRNGQVRLATWLAAVTAASLSAGIAAGLKPAACIFAPGAALGLALTAGGARRFALTGAVFCLGWATGFAVVFAPWGVTVYRLFGNPVFPLLNDIFTSPWISPVSGTDTRFLPKDLWEALFFPFFWLRGRTYVVAELGVRDPRFALAWLSLIVILWHVVRRRLQTGGGRSPIVGKPAAVLGIWFGVTFVVWEATFSILRYILALEVVTGILITLAVLILARGTQRRAIALTGAVLVAIFAVSSRPGWGRLRSYGAAAFDVQAPLVPDHAAVVFVASPTAFVAPFLHGRDLMFVGIQDVPVPSLLSQEVARRLQTRPVIMAVSYGSADNYADLTAKFGFRIQADGCAPIRTDRQRGLVICPTRKTGIPDR
jgi:hypothetical protein